MPSVELPDLDLIPIRDDGPDWLRASGLITQDQIRVDAEPPVELLRAFGGKRLISARAELEAERQVKDASEIATIEHNVEVLNNALRHVGRLIRPGISELQLWSRLEGLLRDAVHGEVGMEGNLATGPERTLEEDPHPVHRELVRGDLVLLDAYPRLNGYYADLTRTWACGPAAPELKRVHDAIASALDRVSSLLRPGAVSERLDQAARDVLAEAGFPEAYAHHTGHGFGVKQQESPWLKPGSNDVLKEGMVVAVEPACYLAGLGGMRLEQDFLITRDGAKPLGDIAFSLGSEAL
jgi:Xaa-Pro aminopeptidase